MYLYRLNFKTTILLKSILTKVTILIFILPLFAFSAHKYYISLTKIDFISEKKAVQITMRFFIDDIENTLENRYQTELELATKKENEKSDFYLEKYIGQKFKININSKEKTYQYLGKEYQNDVVFFYLEITDIEDIDTFEIQNSMLMEDIPEQENYIKINIKNTKKTIILRKDNDKEMLKI